MGQESAGAHAFLGNSAQLTVRTMDDRKRPIFLFLHAANTIVGITCRKHVRSVSASSALPWVGLEVAKVDALSWAAADPRFIDQFPH